jgi:hypothetical protein
MNSDEEAKLKRMTKEVTSLFDQGQLIEAGWVTLRAVILAPDAPQLLVDAMRESFFAGAQHTFTSVAGMVGSEGTEAGARQVAIIHSELEEFLRQFKRKHGLT